MNRSFGKWRYRFWPVYSHEYTKVLPLLFMKLLVSLNYTLLYNTKDTLMIAASAGSGAEVIPVLKGWIVTPAAFLFMLLYTKINNQLSRPKVFYLTIGSFLTFFFLFTFFLYPYREALMPNQSADWLLDYLGPSRSHWVAIYRHWMNSLFYVFADLWGVVVINLLFWTFANQICTVPEAKRFYTLFSAAGDMGAVLSAPVFWHSRFLSGEKGFETTMNYVLLYTLLIGLAVVLLYYKTNRFLTSSGNEERQKKEKEKLETKTKLSLGASLKMVLRSGYLLNLSIIVIGYSLTLNLIEVFWKANLKLPNPKPEDYYSFMSYFSLWTGIVSVLVTLLAAGYIIRRFGWHLSAQITPLFVCLSGLLFFVVFHNQEPLELWFHWLGTTPLLFLAYFGAFQSILSRTCKYAFLDPTKEMAYIPLDEESKIKGKAAVDVLASRLGKSSSSWLQAALIEGVGHGSVLSIASWISPIVLATGSLWSQAVYSLNRRFLKRSHTKESRNE